MKIGRFKTVRWTAVAIILLASQAARGDVIYGEPQILGGGAARLYIDLKEDDSPSALGIGFEKGMLEGLPSKPNMYSRCFDKNGNGKVDGHECNGDFEMIFPLSNGMVKSAKLPFKWISVNWNPKGHPPPAPPPWAVPHFDFHFYIQDREGVRAIRPGRCSELINCEDFKRSQKLVPVKYLHSDHIDVGAAVPDMGNHLIDSKSPDLAKGGPPFTHTFIYGAYDGHITFYEPMITYAYLTSRPDMCQALKLPAAWETSGAYPTRYCIRYHDDTGNYTVSLESFVYRNAE